MFGGCLAEPGMSMGSESSGGVVANDVWAYDQAAQGWEEVKFELSQIGCDLPSGAMALPASRAGHSMVSMTTGAISCGGYGYGADGLTKTYLADDAGRVDCWWLTPGSPPRWDKLKVSSSSPPAAPKPRFGHSMSYDHKEHRVIIFGGQALKGELLNDCWTLSEVLESNGTRADMERLGEFIWRSCDPASQLSLRPQARYGHQSVYFHNSLYVIGGFAQNGLRVAARQDIWVLSLSAAAATPSWSEIMPTTKKPEPRGFHALWLSGFKIILHGGQGPSGVGMAAVLGDTWQFDLFTMEWVQKASSAAVPVMSNLAINPLDNAARAISFGGRDASGKPSGRLYTFAASRTANAWERVYPAGVRPSRRTGNTIVYDKDSERIITSFGMDGAGLQEDTWILDLATSQWTCWYPAVNPTA